jgi:hypothetical protein
VLLLSVVRTAAGTGSVGLQVCGLVMLVVFIVASAVLCRCPRCHRYLNSKQQGVLGYAVTGWGLQCCPHCQALLQA